VDRLIAATLQAARAWVPEFPLLAMIAILEPVTPLRLARETGLRQTTLSDNVQSLLDLGYVTRRPNPSDGRSYLLTTTRSGQRVFRRGSAALRTAHAEVALRLDRPVDEADAALDDLHRAMQGALEVARLPPRPRSHRYGAAHERVGSR
jgi:DNA-binding MarR family transcriptional regulator